MIKKLFSFLCVGLYTVSSLTACASNAKQENKETADQTTEEVNMDGKKLVVYFSHTSHILECNVGYFYWFSVI